MSRMESRSFSETHRKFQRMILAAITSQPILPLMESWLVSRLHRNLNHDHHRPAARFPAFAL